VIPVFQDKFTDKEKGIMGNCCSAAVASLFELSIDETPDFALGSGSTQHFAMDEFAKAQGLEMQYFNIDKNGCGRCIDGYYLVSGRSPRGFMHMVVYLDGELAHESIGYIHSCRLI